MVALATSRNALFVGNQLDPTLIDTLKQYSATNPVAIISNHPAPSWFNTNFQGSTVLYVQEIGRQNGQIILRAANNLNVSTHDIIVLAATDEDLQMGKNGNAVLVAAGWSGNARVAALGINVRNAIELNHTLALTDGWPGGWRVQGSAPSYEVRSLADLSTHYQSSTQQAFGARVTNAVKNGGGCLNALLVLTARSLLAEGIGGGTLWGVYPSSSSANNDTDVLSDFSHRLRTTVSRAHHASRGNPLFIRHTPSIKRSGGGSFNRLDPSNQIETIHLNPAYRASIRGKHVIVVDDCTTYGVSFGVAAAFLRAAGAANVTGVALGKFGNQLQSYNITINTNPFQPVSSGGYHVNGYQPMQIATSSQSQAILHQLIP